MLSYSSEFTLSDQIPTESNIRKLCYGKYCDNPKLLTILILNKALNRGTFFLISPWQGVSNEYNNMFLWRNKKTNDLDVLLTRVKIFANNQS